LRRAFTARARFYPDTQRGAFEVRHVIGDDGDAIWEARNLYTQLASPRPRPLPDVRLDGSLIVSKDVKPFLPLVEIRQPRRQPGFNTRRSLDGSGEFGRMSSRKKYCWCFAKLQLTGDRNADRGVGVQQIACLLMHGRYGRR